MKIPVGWLPYRQRAHDGSRNPDNSTPRAFAYEKRANFINFKLLRKDVAVGSGVFVGDCNNGCPSTAYDG